MSFKTLALIILNLSFAPLMLGEVCDQNKANIFTIDASLANGTVVRLTGFSLQGIHGILTSLHGVAGARKITATPGDSSQPVLLNMQLTHVDIPNDVALLEPHDSTDNLPLGFAVSGQAIVSREFLVECGHPDGNAMHHRDFQANSVPLTVLNSFTAGLEKQFIDRGSPALNIAVYDLDVSMVPGESGAPIIDGGGNIKAIEEGGLDRGAANISWAIPIGNLVLKDLVISSAEYSNLLAHPASTSLFSFERGNLITPHELVVSIHGDGQFWKLKDALRNARFNDTVILKPGTYSIGLTPDASCDDIGAYRLEGVSIVGVGTSRDTIINGCFDVPKGFSVRLSNFSLRGSIYNSGQLDVKGVSLEAGNPLVLQDGSMTTVDSSVIESQADKNDYAITARSNSTLHATNTTLKSSGSDVETYSSSTLTFDRCVFSADWYAVVALTGGDTEITNSNLSDVEGVLDKAHNTLHLSDVLAGYVRVDGTNRLK